MRTIRRGNRVTKTSPGGKDAPAPLKLMKRRLDALARRLTFERDSYCCCHCGSYQRIQWCHVVSRRYLSTRWDSNNLLTLCAGCHLWWHHQPLESANWFQQKYPRRADMLRIIRQNRTCTDMKGLLLRMEGGKL